MVAIVIAIVTIAARSCGAPSVVADAPASTAKVPTRVWVQSLRDRHPGGIAGTVDVAAFVCATVIDGEPICAMTGANGRYALSAPAGVYAVWASAPAHLGERREQVRVDADATTDGIDFSLASAGARVHGVVRDTKGHALPGALVFVGPSGDAPGYTATTGADGAFDAWAAPGDVIVAASAVGFVDGHEHVVAPSDTVAIALLAASSISGIVVDAGTHAPVAGATVEGGGARATSNPDGTYRLDKLEPGRYKPTATKVGGYGEAAESVRIGVGHSVGGVTIEIQPVAVVVGHLVIDDGGTQRGCPEGDGNVGLTRYGSSASYHAKTTVDGAVVLEGVVPGTYEIWVSCPGWLSETPYPDLVVGDSDVDDVVWLVHRGARVTGRVVDRAGKPIAESRVNYTSSGGVWSGSVSVAADGSFAIEGVLEGAVDVSASAVGYLSVAEHTTVIATLAGVATTLVLERGARLDGIVVDEDGAPVPYADVRISGDDSSGSVSVDEHGVFARENLTPGRYELSLELGFHANASVVVAMVSLDHPAHVKLVAPIQRGSITGVVTDTAGRPLDDVYIDVGRETPIAPDDRGRDPDRTDDIDWRYDRKLVGPDGSFAITGLPLGKTYSIRARRAGAHDALAHHIAIGTTTTIVMRPTGTIAGVVTSGTGAPVDDVTISLADRAIDVSRDERLFHTHGAFALHDLPAGHYRIVVDSDPRSRIFVDLAEGQEVRDVRLVTQPRYTLRGKLVDLHGAPLARWKVEAPKLQSDERHGEGHIMVWDDVYSVTGADGAFLVRDLPGGELTLSGADATQSTDPPLQVLKTLTLAGPTTVLDLGTIVVTPVPTGG